MLLNCLKNFCQERDVYSQKFVTFLELTELTHENETAILELLCDLLMNPEYARDVSEHFPQLLLILLTMAIKKDQDLKSDRATADLVHQTNCTIIGKLILIHPDVLSFALEYFELNPAPFENLGNNTTVPIKRRKILEYFHKITDFDIVDSTYNILQASPDHFKHRWNWSKFYKYLSNEDDKVKWLAMKCIAVVLEMSESLRIDCAKTLIRNLDSFITDTKENNVNIVNQLSIPAKETEEIAKNISSVVSVAGVLLPVFRKQTKDVKSDLISVPSMEENLRSLALAVASRKCVCLQGAVGCGKTAIVEHLAKITGHGPSDFVKVQLGDQTDSKMLLGTYRCTDIPGEFIWQPGVLTQAVLAGKWLLLEDIDSAALDVASVLSNLIETGTLSVPGYRDTIHVKSGFQLFVTQRLIPSATGLHRKISGATSLLEKHWLCVNMEPLSQTELVTIVQALFPVLQTVAVRMVDVFLLFSVGNHETNVSDENRETILKTGRLISTRDLIKWCSRASVDFVVNSKDSALKIFQDAIDIFCCSVPNQEQRLTLAIAIGAKLGIIKTKAQDLVQIHKPVINLTPNYFIGGRSKLERKKWETAQIERDTTKFSFTRPSACLLERIASCVVQNEPVLLVGETGTGKTSSVQYLAKSTGHKLIVINMNQQSESADLLGGYKPVDMKFLIFPIREEFELLFRSFFAVEPNKKFLDHIGVCYEKGKWKTLVALMNKSTSAAVGRLRAKVASVNGESKSASDNKDKIMLKKWERISAKLDKLTVQVKNQLSLAFAFIEGSLIKALKEGYWVLLDEINLANAETLECLSGLLERSSGSLSLLERGDKESIKRHQDFTIFACMNPATDVGKKELPIGLRNRFTEFYIDELVELSDLLLLVSSYLEELNLLASKKESIVKFYLKVREIATTTLFDGTGHKPHYSLRTLCRALSVAATNPCGVVQRSLYEAFCLSFLTQLNDSSYPIVQKMIIDYILDKTTAKAVIGAPIPKPSSLRNDDYVEFEGYWVVKGSMESQVPETYILTPSVRRNLKDVVRVVSIGKMPILLQGDTSVGKTSLITYLAKASGHVCVRINNHEHTDLQEYIGSYVADESGRLVFKEGILVEAMRKGYWIILDELNLAPSDVLEALNRVLDDNRELFIPETQQIVKAHENFMLFATQNPPGLYGGRKVLSRAFRNRFAELHFDEIPAAELETILHERCSMPLSYCKQIISVMTDLQVRRKNTAAFAGKQGFITLRDLFRWGERYRLAPDMGHKLYDWSQHLADEGYLVLAAKVRRPEEAEEIREVIKKHLKRDVDPENLFTLSDKTSPVTKAILEEIEQEKDSSFAHVVWTYHMRRMAVLVRKSYQFKEPVLLVGETGGGKTTVCQLIAYMNAKKLYVVNCHMHTESSDFLGNLRPVRNQTDEENQKLFEWVDGPLITAMQKGDFFLADEISLADDSVLERLNSLLEPERKLLLAEKGIDIVEGSKDVDNTIVAHENFFFIGTMNPGGDYGKKELSPALRNRFTEIWCDGCTKREDLQAIIEHNLTNEVGNNKKYLAEGILNFVEWLPDSDVGKRFTVSIRDILSWVNFINAIVEKEKKFKLSVPDAFFHGAFLTYIDSLGSGLTSMESIEKLKLFKEDAFAFLLKQMEKLSAPPADNQMELDSGLPSPSNDVFGIAPFYIPKGSNEYDESSASFTFLAPTTQQNALKLLRALQLSKPILLEGSPGVGKTSLVSALAKVSGHACLRINLSDQTDVSDLFGADLPVEGGKGGEFAWRDGPFLRALKAGHWILLDELNLASQSVLEGLNACFDHRGEVYIPELGKTFSVKPETKLFACQNPLRQGGARRGLPKSFLNRFTQVFVDALTDEDLKFIVGSQFSQIEKDDISKMIEFNSRLSKEAGVSWGFYGAPWEMNLRDVTRWCEATIAAAETNGDKQLVCNPGSSVELIYVDRMRTKEDKNKVKEIYGEIFTVENYPLLPSPVVHVTNENVYFGEVNLKRTKTAEYTDQNLLILRDQISTLRSLAQCVKRNWMSIIVGGSGCGKSSVVRVLSQMTGQKLKSIVVNSAMDTTEILGGFEQTDYNRHLEQLVEKTENLLTQFLKTKVRKENISQIEKFQALIERVRELSHAECESITMVIATEFFLEKVECLSALLKEMKTFESSMRTELQAIESDLEKLKEHVEMEKCLNAGGKFEWVDSILVKCLREGTWLLVDQVNLCSPAVLDRLNGLLEPNGVLSIGERGVDSDGNVVTIRPHENFRLFLTIDPKYGEISRAMRNRGVEIFMLNYNENLDSGKLDFRSLLHNTGLTKRNHQEALMAVHKRMSEDPSNTDNLNVIQLLHTSFLVVQQLSRGFSAFQAFMSSCKDVYLRARSIFHGETRFKLTAIVEDTIREYEVNEGDDYVFDLDAATCSLKNLQDNSKLTLLRQQGLLLDWCANGYVWALNHPELTEFPPKTDFINQFFASLFGDKPAYSTDILHILPYVLLNFYEHSTPSDAALRAAWAHNIFKQCDNFAVLNNRNKTLANQIQSFGFGDYDESLPWDRKNFENANNLALSLFFDALVVDEELDSDWIMGSNEKIIRVGQFSKAQSSGKMTIKLKDQPLVSNFLGFLAQIEKCIDDILKNTKRVIDDSQYMIYRQKLKYINRFGNMGRLILINKTVKSKSIFGNLDECILLLKVHYKWLKKFFTSLEEDYKEGEINDEHKEDITDLKRMMEEIDNSLMSTYDPFRKVCKAYRRHINPPLPCSQDLILNCNSNLQSITESFTPSKNRYIGTNLSRERKFFTLQTKEALHARSLLITLWSKITSNEILSDEVLVLLDNLNKFCQERLNIVESNEGVDSESEALSPKELVKTTAKVQMWPIHEHMFTIYVNMLQRKLCEKLDEKNFNLTLPSISIPPQQLDIPNIPVQLLAVLKTISAKQEDKIERNRLLLALFIWFLPYTENSYAIGKYKQISHWKITDGKDKLPEVSDTDNISSGPVLINLVTELLLNKSQQPKSDKSAVVIAAPLGNYSTRLRQLKDLNDLLWKNSVAINSRQFNQEANDLKALQSLIDDFLLATDGVQATCSIKKCLEDENLRSAVQSTIKTEYVEPLMALLEISDHLKKTEDGTDLDRDETEQNTTLNKGKSEEYTTLARGKAWIYLGYLQAFIFSNMGYIDPVHKVALKLRYIEEDIADCENTAYIAKLYSRTLGLMDDHTVHPRLAEVERHLVKLNDEKNSLQNLKAVRPPHADFVALSKEFTNFRVSLGAYKNVKKHIEQLTEAIKKLKKEVNDKNKESAKSAKREAEIYLESIRKFMDQVETKYLSGYPDIVFPILAGLVEMRHGLYILIVESSKQIAIAETDVKPNNIEAKSSDTDEESESIESFLHKLVCFPTIGPHQDSLLELVKLCTTYKSREKLNANVKSEKTFVALQEQFRLTIAGLYEFYNYIVLKGGLTIDLWSDLNLLLKQIVLIWQQQQQEIERNEVEKENLYKNRTKVQGGSLTEEEEIAQELKALFPTYRDEDFADVDDAMHPSLEKKVKVKSKEEDFGALITENDIKEVQNIHSNIVKSFTTSEWLQKRNNDIHPDFIEPLLQRYNTFGLLMDNVAPALGNELTGKLYTSLNVLTQLTIRLSQGETLNPESCIRNVKKESRLYDYYKDSNVEEVQQCLPLLESIYTKVTDLLKEWPEHPTLVSIKTILQRLYSFPMTSPVSRFLTGLEMLLVKLHEWEANAHSGVSMQGLIVTLTQQIISWRKLELACWKDCLTTKHLKLRSHASKWWFFLYSLFDSYVDQTTEKEKPAEEALTPKKLIESLELFMTESTIVEFEARLDLLLTFHCHAYYLESSVERSELLAISWNVYNYYKQFLPDIENKIKSIKVPIEKKLKDFVKIARWNDINYWSVKETVDKTHRTLHKFIKEFENSLKEPVTPFLIVKPVYKSEAGIWDRPAYEENISIDPDNYVISKPQTINIHTVKSELVTEVDRKYLSRARKLCKQAILSSSYPSIRVDLDDFIEEFMKRSARLRALEINRDQPKPKQKAEAKSILQQKRTALADYFKQLLAYGIHHRTGNLAWKNRQDDILDFTIPPVEITAALNFADADSLEKNTRDQWESCERYYYGSLIKLAALSRTLTATKSDLGAQNIEWCRGFSTHLMLLANKQKRHLASVLKYFVSLRNHVSDLSKLDFNKFTNITQEELKTVAKDLKDLLITARACFEQFLIYMQACPTEVLVEGEDNCYSLCNNDLPVNDCRKNDEIWQKAVNYIKESLNIVLDISKRWGTVFTNMIIIPEDNETNKSNVTVITSKHFIFLVETFDSLRKVHTKVQDFAITFNTLNEDKHPLLENIQFIETKVSSQIDHFEKLLQSSEQEPEINFSLYQPDFDDYESVLDGLIETILLVIQNKYKDAVAAELEASENVETKEDEVSDEKEGKKSINENAQKNEEAIDEQEKKEEKETNDGEQETIEEPNDEKKEKEQMLNDEKKDEEEAENDENKEEEKEVINDEKKVEEEVENDEGENNNDYEKNMLKEKLIYAVAKDVNSLKLKEIHQYLTSILETISESDDVVVLYYFRVLKKCLPLMQQYLKFVQFYLNEQIASYRITCKILHMQLNVFLDLASNGFCMPKDLDLEQGEEGEESSNKEGGMGLGDGEGEKDVSDRIETEDQLEDAKPAGQEKETPEDKDCAEEDKGIEMSEDFEGKLQDVEEKENEDGDQDDEDDDDIDKQMGDTSEGADKLDEQIWDDEEDEEPQGEETNKNEEELGDGERTGEKEFGAKDERTTEDPEDKGNNEEETEKQEQKEINEMEEPEYDEDQVNPYHGKHQPEPEPEPLDLPEEMNIDDDDTKDEEQQDEENPFDIDKMKENMPPPETKECEEPAADEDMKEDETKKDDSSDEEDVNDAEKAGDKTEQGEEIQEEEPEEESDKQGPELAKEAEGDEEKPEEPEMSENITEEKAEPSTDEASKELDAAEQADEREGGSKDQVASNVENKQDAPEESNAENWQDEKQDKGTGQSQAEQHDAGHSGSSMEKSTPMPTQENESKEQEKRKHPGQSDETHTLAEKIEPDKKKLKTMIHAQEQLPDEKNNKEGAEKEEGGDPDMCQHVKEKDKFDHYAMDAATEEQSKEQASNMEQDEKPPHKEEEEEEEQMDVDMHEDVEIVEDETVAKQNPEKPSDNDKSKEKPESKEKGRAEDGQLEAAVDIEGENAETMTVSRGAETAFFTNLTAIDNETLLTRPIEQRRQDVENMLSQWTHVPTTEEAVVAWNTLSSVTDAAARDLSEKLRLVLEPTQASRLKGDYRTGRRINMRKIIPYIASQFRKDKIWMRRTKPSKRDYQIVLAIDDSSSMADNHSKELAFESLSLISKAMTYLEAGQLAVLSFGEKPVVVHPLGETFNEQSGSRLMQEMRFDQKETKIGQLVNGVVNMLEEQSNSTDNAKLLLVLSDGRNIFSEGTDTVNRAVRRARLADVFLVFIIVDNPKNKDSILDIRMPVFREGKLVGINSYMDSFPFPFYMILRDINALPGVLSDALRQWFEVVGKIDT